MQCTERKKPCMISIVAYFPRYDGMPDDEYVEYYHGAIAVPDTFMKKFVERIRGVHRAAGAAGRSSGLLHAGGAAQG
eukprot:3871246-Prymnesium_polylepis.1